MKWALLLAGLALAAGPAEVWRFDSLERIGGHAPKVEGQPQRGEWRGGVRRSPDALFFDTHPLAGAKTWTWEVVFRPDPGGAAEQRFFHLQQDGAATRMLFEIRVEGSEWWLDSYAHSEITGRR